jgi:hypothetical protein
MASQVTQLRALLNSRTHRCLCTTATTNTYRLAVHLNFHQVYHPIYLRECSLIFHQECLLNFLQHMFRPTSILFPML